MKQEEVYIEIGILLANTITMISTLETRLDVHRQQTKLHKRIVRQVAPSHGPVGWRTMQGERRLPARQRASIGDRVLIEGRLGWAVRGAERGILDESSRYILANRGGLPARGEGVG